MDILTQQKFMKWAIIVLVLLNICTLTFLWLSKSGEPISADPLLQRSGQIDVMPFLKEELKLNDEQANKIFSARKEHQKKIKVLLEKIQLTKHSLMGSVFENKNVNADSLAGVIANSQKQIELLTHDHLIKLKNILGPEQEQKLKRLFGELYIEPARRGGMPPPPGR